VARVFVCEECGGAGAHGYARGPAVERCPRCRGAGVRFADPQTAARDLRELLASTTSPELVELGEGAAVRALAAALALVEERLAAVEAELQRRR
jgi:hypothetical protein